MLLTRKATSSAVPPSRLARRVPGVLAKTMDRRTFLKRSGIGVGAGAVASQLPFSLVEKAAETIQVEEYAPHPDGLHTYVSTKFPLYDEEGQVSAVAGISTDVTDRIRARDAEEQFKTACHVQQRLYPVSPPSIPGFDIACRWVPAAQLCGDYFDYVWRDEKHLVIAVGDICGHGLGPALQMVETRKEQPAP